MPMTRTEHLDWAKQRALEYVDAGDNLNAIISLVSDLRKHEELDSHTGIELTTSLITTGNLDTSEKVRRHIEGFN